MKNQNLTNLIIASSTSDNKIKIPVKKKMTENEREVRHRERSVEYHNSTIAGYFFGLFHLPYHIFAVSKAFQKSASDRFPTLNVISLLINHKNYRHKYTPINIAGVNIPTSDLFQGFLHLVIITNNKTLNHFFRTIFKWNPSAYPNLQISLFNTIEEAAKVINFNGDLSNIIFISYLQYWSNIVDAFKGIKYNLSGGKNGSRHMISPLIFKFTISLLTLGFRYEDIKFYFNLYENDLITYGKNYQKAVGKEVENWEIEIEQTLNSTLEPSANKTTLGEGEEKTEGLNIERMETLDEKEKTEGLNLKTMETTTESNLEQDEDHLENI